MRNLRAYMCTRIVEDECTKETCAVYESLAEIEERMNKLKLEELLLAAEDEENVLKARAYTHILRWRLAEPGFSKWKAEKKVDGDELRLLRTYIYEIDESASSVVEEYARAHMYASCIVNGRTFFYIDYKDIVYRSDIEVRFTHCITDTTDTCWLLGYRTRYGPIAYEGKEITLGAYTLSAYLAHNEPCIYSCHLSYRIKSHRFIYHLCTNTLRYSANGRMPTDYTCTRGRILELWCRKREIVQKFVRIRSAHISDEEQTVHNFL